ncbi:unnamed protein product [Polarella glacialis]|uniref:Uncharacterized protein n=1 Tax=Polarella glacialis TaxID=89957 RepID=A0A813K5T5_POLGL|nr:unnamed protein product [Polarella glacialis]
MAAVKLIKFVAVAILVSSSAAEPTNRTCAGQNQVALQVGVQSHAGTCGCGEVCPGYEKWLQARPGFVPYAFPQRTNWLLVFWQRRLLFQLATAHPEKRRIFWIMTATGGGKGAMTEFIYDGSAWASAIFDHVPLVFRGCCEATYLIQKPQDFAMRYDNAAINGQPPGVVVLDCPKEFRFTPEYVSTIEKLIDVGQRQCALPTEERGEFRPFTRKLTEFKFWVSTIRAVAIGFVMTFFSAFDLPVFWPILLAYFIVLFVLTMKDRVRHMMKHKYLPISLGKQTYGDCGKVEVPGADKSEKSDK